MNLDKLLVNENIEETEKEIQSINTRLKDLKIDLILDKVCKIEKNISCRSKEETTKSIIAELKNQDINKDYQDIKQVSIKLDNDTWERFKVYVDENKEHKQQSLISMALNLLMDTYPKL